MSKNKQLLLEAEKRFNKFAGLEENLAAYPLHQNISTTETNKAKSKEFSEVFTPLWLVDQMIDQVQFTDVGTTTLDLCAGYGQFSIRLMRKFYQEFGDFNVNKFLTDTHAFSELQLSSCFKMLLIFDYNINLFIGDSTHLSKLPVNAKGIWCYIESYGYWVCLTKTIQHILRPKGVNGGNVKEATFVKKVEALIAGFNALYTTMQENNSTTLQQLLTNPQGRLELIHQLNQATADSSLQSVDTPVSVIVDMLDKVEELEKKSILVLFNCEIVEALIHKKKIDPANITFGVDFGGDMKAKAMAKMYGVDTVKMADKFLFVHQEFKGRKFDVCLSNPPYNGGLDLKILQALLANGTEQYSLAKEYVFVHPSTWLLDQKDKKPLYGNLKAMLANKLKSVKLFNGNGVFGIELFVPCSITHIDIERATDKIQVELFGAKYSVEFLKDITKFGSDWNSTVEPFFEKMKGYVSAHGSVWDHNEHSLNSTKIYCQLAAIRGDVKDRGKIMTSSIFSRDITTDNFYTLVMRDVQENKGIRSAINKGTGGDKPTFGFSSENERDNFLTYLTTDFARFCLALSKINAHTDRGELSLIPWLDFTQAWDDGKLFTHFDVNKDTQDYIRKFLPDYYGLRK